MSDQAEAWRRVRRVADRDRSQLTALAARLHGDLPQVAGTGLLCRAGWLPAAPSDLDEVVLAWRGQAPPPALTGTGEAVAHVLPPAADGSDRSDGSYGSYGSYAEAIAALDRPALFEDRFCYRLLGAGPASPVPAGPVPAGPAAAAGPARPGARLVFGAGRYFEAVNLGHAVAHELAAAWAASPGHPPGLGGLPLRTAVGDPCDLSRRAALTAVSTLTLRRAPGGAASFLLHWRDPARVNHAGGLYQVMPAGIFQPVSDSPAARREDFSLWRCMAREFSEELLGGSEDYPTSSAGVLDYAAWPFHRQLAGARDSGGLRVSYLGLGVDPLTLATDILTVAVFDAAVFDRLFRGLVRQNAEGRVVTEHGSAAIPFTEATIGRLTGGGEPVQAAGAALLRLAWQHRRALLG